MYVIKRSGNREAVHFDKITSRISKLSFGLNNKFVQPLAIAQSVIQGLFDGVTTTQLDNLAAETAASMAVIHPDYAILAARIAVSNLHKNTKKLFSRTVEDLYHYVDPKTNEKAPLIADDIFEIIMKNKERIDASIIHHRDFSYDFFGFKTLEYSHLMKINGKIYISENFIKKKKIVLGYESHISCNNQKISVYRMISYKRIEKQYRYNQNSYQL